MLQQLQLHLCCTPLGAVYATAAATVFLTVAAVHAPRCSIRIDPFSFFPRARKKCLRCTMMSGLKDWFLVNY